MRTKSILGYKLTLEIGTRYLATHPMRRNVIKRGRLGKVPVTIVRHDNPLGSTMAYVGDLPYEKAKRFLNAFNNGKTIFDGRKW